MHTTESKAAAAVRIGAGLALRKRSELLGLLRPCFARTEPWLQAGKYVSALASELPLDDAKRLPEYRSTALGSLQIQLFSPAPISVDLERIHASRGGVVV